MDLSLDKDDLRYIVEEFYISQKFKYCLILLYFVKEKQEQHRTKNQHFLLTKDI